MPKHPNDAGIVWLSAIRFEGQPRRDGVRDQQGWNPEPECDPQQFRWRHAQGAMLVQRDERQSNVYSGATVKQQGPGQTVPNGDGDAQATLRHRYRNQAERVVDEMGSDI